MSRVTDSYPGAIFVVPFAWCYPWWTHRLYSSGSTSLRYDPHHILMWCVSPRWTYYSGSICLNTANTRRRYTPPTHWSPALPHEIWQIWLVCFIHYYLSSLIVCISCAIIDLWNLRLYFHTHRELEGRKVLAGLNTLSLTISTSVRSHPDWTCDLKPTTTGGISWAYVNLVLPTGLLRYQH